MKKKILLAFGTRPEAIKMGPVYLALMAQPDLFETICCVTAQHREMLDEVLEIFGIVPDFDLDLMQPGQGLEDLHARVLLAVRDVLAQAKPDMVLVHGDTTTTAATAQAAFFAGIPVAHVEAGLRSGDLAAPFPEEMNRRYTDMVATVHFAPTADNRARLLAEGHDPAAVVVTGNTVVDAVHLVSRSASASPEIEARLSAAIPFDWRTEPFVVVTCHRRENHGEAIDAICAAIGRLSEAYPGIRFLFAVHPNPAISRAVSKQLAGRDRIALVDPLTYDLFLHLLRHCRLILTDSGGLQEEGLALGKPVLVMRDVTERPEGIAAGGVRLVGTRQETIVSEVSALLLDPARMTEMSAAENPYGDGRAAARIVEFLAGYKLG